MFRGSRKFQLSVNSSLLPSNVATDSVSQATVTIEEDDCKYICSVYLQLY